MTTGDHDSAGLQLYNKLSLPSCLESIGIELPEVDADDDLYGGLRLVEDAYTVGEQLGEGTYGLVSLGTDKRTKEQVALKEVRLENIDCSEGFPITSLREVKLLSSLEHENILKLKEIVRGHGQKGSVTIYLVFEYLDHDLSGLCMRNKVTRNKFKLPQVKCVLKQLLQGLAYCHLNNVMHRDLKPSNILVNQRGELKLADFGLARTYIHAHPDSAKRREAYTPRVITLWYRPPELFLGPKQYGPEVDVWSVGCILAELLLGGEALFQGDGRTNELDQLDKICAVLGAPTEENWPGVSLLPGYELIQPLVARHSRPIGLRQYLSRRGVKDESALQLLEQLLQLDPLKRISAMDALKSSFFWEEPLPCPPTDLVSCVKQSCHELTTKKRIREERTSGQPSSVTSSSKRVRAGGYHGDTYLWDEPAPRHNFQQTRGPYGAPGRPWDSAQKVPSHSVRPVMPPPKFHESLPPAGVAALASQRPHASNPYAPTNPYAPPPQVAYGLSSNAGMLYGPCSNNNNAPYKSAYSVPRSLPGPKQAGRPQSGGANPGSRSQVGGGTTGGRPQSGIPYNSGWRLGPNSKGQNPAARAQAGPPFNPRPVGYRAG